MALEGAELGFTSGLSVLSHTPCCLSLPFHSAQDPFFFKWCAHHISNLIRPQAQLLGMPPVRPDV